MVARLLAVDPGDRNLRTGAIFAGLLALGVLYYFARVRGKVDPAWASGR